MVDWRGSLSPRRIRDRPPGVRPASREARFWLMPCRAISAARPGRLDCDVSSMCGSVTSTMRHVKPHLRPAANLSQTESHQTLAASEALPDGDSEGILRRVESQDLVQALKRLSKRDDRTQESLADVSGVSRVTISRWFTGKADPDLPNFVKVVAKNGYTMAQLEGEHHRLERANKALRDLLESAEDLEP